jgi:serine protease Do
VSLASIHAAPVVAAKAAKSATEAVRHEGKRPRDQRFDSVVIVNNPSGALGTGFFVRSDIVLTNWHVIDGAGFARMTNYAGEEADRERHRIRSSP